VTVDVNKMATIVILIKQYIKLFVWFESVKVGGRGWFIFEKPRQTYQFVQQLLYIIRQYLSMQSL